MNFLLSIIYTLIFISIEIANWFCKMVFRIFFALLLKTIGRFLFPCGYECECLVCTDMSLPQCTSLLPKTMVHQLFLSVEVCTMEWWDNLALKFLLEHKQLGSLFFSLSSSITPSFFLLALMNSAQQKCPVEEVCLWRIMWCHVQVLCLLILALVVMVMWLLHT